ncbi:uncharacterized protein EV420DRAFT_739329 [Desarmillaria tabescens]|uniref:F-box domain-containing protein n=1 Tax=Armillaria tabescens TaxID=1929756 RepID=A0AA39JX48_ARMTA|nr:uncharacterized protein EV420DRAFT_739329 [Desarmillaria tabescens]KAK0450546.1 hypothetical protein EV420DRAFT_739329 [Desarmillaria tabescens]
MSQQPTIPQEIIDFHIISKLSQDLPALRACALVCRAWRIPAQNRLFFHVELGCPLDSDKSNCDDFRRVLVYSPHLASYVRVLDLADGMGSRKWMTRSKQHLSAILPQLVNLIKIEVRFNSIETSWSDISTLQDPLRRLFQHPHVERILLRGLSKLPDWDALFGMLTGCRAGHVRLYHVTLDPRTRSSRRRNGPAVRRPKCTIGTLDVNLTADEMEDFAFWANNPRSCMDISGLRRFCYYGLEVGEFAACNNVLNAAAFSSLDTFELRIEDPYTYITTPNFVPLAIGRLRHFQITLEDTFESRAIVLCNLVQWCTRLFENTGPNTIEVVTLSFAQWATEHRDLDQQLAEWNALDAMLLRPHMHALRHVTLVSDSEFAHDRRAAQAFLGSRVADMFPLLRARGILRVV